MKLRYFLISEDVLVDQRSNKVSAHKIVDRLVFDLATPRKPGSSTFSWVQTHLVTSVVFSSAEPTSEDHKFWLSIKTPRRDVPELEFPADFDGKLISRSYVEMPGLPDDGEGLYQVALRFVGDAGEELRYWDIDVVCEKLPDDAVL